MILHGYARISKKCEQVNRSAKFQAAAEKQHLKTNTTFFVGLPNRVNGSNVHFHQPVGTLEEKDPDA